LPDDRKETQPKCDDDPAAVRIMDGYHGLKISCPHPAAFPEAGRNNLRINNIQPWIESNIFGFFLIKVSRFF
jgi:hypothetical protein